MALPQTVFRNFNYADKMAFVTQDKSFDHLEAMTTLNLTKCFTHTARIYVLNKVQEKRKYTPSQYFCYLESYR